MVSNMDERKHSIYLSLGSNLGDRKGTIEKALNLLEVRLGKMLCKSSYYVTEGWGKGDLNEFYNLTAVFETKENARKALKITQSIEIELGRLNKTSGNDYSNRSIDIDILFFDQQIINTTNLIIPHALLHQRKFVLMPLNETSSLFIHPVLQKTIAKLLSDSKDDSECKKMLN